PQELKEVRTCPFHKPFWGIYGKPSKILEQSVDVARGVAKAKAAKRLSKAKMARQASTIAAVKGQPQNHKEQQGPELVPMGREGD
ncbi:hypothetical protein TrRE_jg5973, partial [Triparma retinervis]